MTTAIADYDGRIRHTFETGFVASEWTVDGRYLLGAENDSGDTEGTVAAEVSVFDAVTSTYAVITSTPSIIEQNPSLCLRNDLITYDDDNGNIVIARLVRN